MGDVASVRYCESCGGELPSDARFCAHCGSVQDIDQDSPTSETVSSDDQGGEESTESSGSPKRTGLKILIGVVLVAVFAGVVALVVSLASGGGSSGMALVFEPGRDGPGDVFVVGALGDPYEREDRVLSDVELVGGFSEAIAATQWIRRYQADFEVGGDRLIAYREEGDDEITLGVIGSSGHDVVPLADGKGWLSVSRTLSGDLFAGFYHADRCVMYRIGSADDVERLGRGTLCEVVSSGAVLIVDSRSSKTDISVHRPDGTTTEFDIRDAVNSANLSPGGTLVALSTWDPDTGASLGIEIFDAETAESIEDVNLPTGSSFLGFRAVLDAAVVFEVTDEGIRSLSSLGVNGEDLLVEGDSVVASASPDGTHVLIGSTSYEDGDADYSILDVSSGELVGDTTVDSEGVNAVGWLSNDGAVIVSLDGDVVVVDLAGQESDAGAVGTDVSGGSVRLREGGIATVDTAYYGDDESLGVFASGSRNMLNVIDGAYWVWDRGNSRDGRFLAVTAKEDSDDEDLILYVFDLVDETLIEVDEDRDFDSIVFDGSTVIYGVQVSDDDDDVETRRFDLVSQARPEVIYEGAIAIVPGADTP